VEVLNPPPVASLQGPASGLLGEELTFTLGASDTTPGDEAAGFTFAIDWNGDGTTDQTVTGLSGTQVTHSFADIGVSTVGLTATDQHGAVSAPATFTVEVLNPPPVANLQGPTSGLLGEELTFTLGASDATPGDEAAGFTFAIDWNGDGTTDQTVAGLSGTQVTHSFTDIGVYHVGLTATDQHGAVSAQATLAVEALNTAAVASLQGPTSGLLGAELTFTLRATDTTPGDEAAGFTFAVDWNGDGTTDQTVTGPSGTQVTHSFADIGVYHVGLTATDQHGAVSAPAATLTVEVLNTAPVAALQGTSSGVRGQELSFTLRATDTTPGDATAGFTFAIDWDGNGTTDQTVVGPSGAVVTHHFSEVGVYHVGLTATDQHGAVSTPAGLDVSITAVALQDGVLVVGGTAGNDVIVIEDAKGGKVHVEINGKDAGTFSAPGLVRVFGYEGDDIIWALGYSGKVEEFGGAGNDLLVASRGGSILYGEAGNDILLGASSGDVLVQGAGSPLLLGGSTQGVVIESAGKDRFAGVAWGKGGNPLHALNDFFAHLGEEVKAGGQGKAKGRR
jgi:PKD repeat protein